MTWFKISASFFGMAVVFALSGCVSTYSSIDPRNSEVDSNGKGVIVGSVQALTRKEASLDLTVSFGFENTETGERGSVGTGSMWEVAQADGPGIIKGKLFAVALPPGSYVIDNWGITTQDGHNYPKSPRKAPFTVEEDKVLYLGSLGILVVLEEESLFGQQYVAGGAPVITDQSHRDIPLLVNKFEFLHRSDITKDIVEYEEAPSAGN